MLHTTSSTAYTAAQLDAEMAWEAEMARLGHEKWEDRNDKNIANGDLGDAVMSKGLQRLIERVEQHRSEFLENSGKKDLGIELPFHLISAEKIAHIILKTAVSEPYDRLVGGKGTLQVAKKIAHNLRDQITYEDWLATSREEANEMTKSLREEAAKKGLKKNVVKKLKSTADWFLEESKGKVSRSALSRWRQKMEHLKKHDWDEDTLAKVGLNAQKLLCEALPEWFALENVQANQRQQRQLIVKDAFVEFLKRERLEAMLVASPSLLPMIVPPKRWELVDESVL